MSQARTLDDLDFRPKLIMGVEGEQSSGKTMLGISAALSRPPLTLMRFDFASQGALRAAKKAGLADSITLRDYDIDITKDLAEQAFSARVVAQKAKGKNEREVQVVQKEADVQLAAVKSRAQEVYEDFMHDYEEALTLGGTVVIDTFTEVYDMVRLALFGMLKQVAQLNYERSNKQMLHLITMAENSESNLIVINKLREDWIEGADGKKRRSGKMVTDGWDKLVFPAHIMLRLYREGTKSDPDHEGPPKNAPGAFYAFFTKCNDAIDDHLTGTSIELPDALTGFDTIGQAVYGSDWNS